MFEKPKFEKEPDTRVDPHISVIVAFIWTEFTDEGKIKHDFVTRGFPLQEAIEMEKIDHYQIATPNYQFEEEDRN